MSGEEEYEPLPNDEVNHIGTQTDGVYESLCGAPVIGEAPTRASTCNKCVALYMAEKEGPRPFPWVKLVVRDAT